MRNAQIFSEAQRELLSAVLNRIIPHQSGRPGAGDLGVAAFVENFASETPVRTRLFNQGLNALDTAVSEGPSGSFLDLEDQAKDDAIRKAELTNPTFFQQLVLQTYNGYYTDTRILDIIGYNVPKPPATGARPTLMDESLLDKQRRRAPFWRKV